MTSIKLDDARSRIRAGAHRNTLYTARAMTKELLSCFCTEDNHVLVRRLAFCHFLLSVVDLITRRRYVPEIWELFGCIADDVDGAIEGVEVVKDSEACNGCVGEECGCKAAAVRQSKFVFDMPKPLRTATKLPTHLEYAVPA